MAKVKEIRTQLVGMCAKVDLDETAGANATLDSDASNGANNNSNPADGAAAETTPLETRIRKAITAGFFAHTARLEGDGEYKTFKLKQHVKIHPSSCLAPRRPTKPGQTGPGGMPLPTPPTEVGRYARSQSHDSR